MPHPFDLIPGIFCCFGLIFVCLSIAVQWSMVVTLGAVWWDFARGFGFVLVMLGGFVGIAALSIWLFG